MEDFVQIAALESSTEAEILGSILTERQIPHLIQAYQSLAQEAESPPPEGWGVIQAQLDKQREILFILADLRKDGGRPGQ